MANECFRIKNQKIKREVDCWVIGGISGYKKLLQSHSAIICIYMAKTSYYSSACTWGTRGNENGVNKKFLSSNKPDELRINGFLLGLFPTFIFVADPVGCTAPFKIDAHPLTLDGTEVTACSSSYHGHNKDDYGG